MNKILPIIAVLSLIFSSACKKSSKSTKATTATTTTTTSSNPTPAPSPTSTTSAHIYVGGQAAQGLQSAYWKFNAEPAPTYWDGGTMTTLSTGAGSIYALNMNNAGYLLATGTATDAGNDVLSMVGSTTTTSLLSYKSSIAGMFITKAEEIYTAGKAGFGQYHSNAFISFWPSLVSQPVQLSSDANAYANAITVYTPTSGDTIVYIAGATLTGPASAILWKYNMTTNVLVETNLDVQDYSAPTANVVGVDSTGNVYVGGFDGRGYLTYWKNGGANNGGTTVRLTANNGDHAGLSGIFLSGTDVYVSGNDSGGATNLYHAAYWKNGTTKVELDSGATKNFADALFVSNEGDVYAAGTNSSGQAAIWVNGGDTNGGQTITSSDATVFTSIYEVKN